MKDIKRHVSTGFWNDDKVLNEFSPEDKYFMLYLLTNPYTSQLGIYHLPIKKVALELGYSIDAVMVLLERFEKKYKIIKYNGDTCEVAIKNYLKHSIIKGGKPVADCLEKDIKNVTDKSLVSYVFDHIKCSYADDDLNNTVIELINKYINNKDKDKDKERYVDVSYHDSSKQKRKTIPPTEEEVREYCEKRNNNVNVKKFMSYYESNGWMVGRNKMKDWQATVRTWEQNDYDRKGDKRGNRGTVEEFTPFSEDELRAFRGESDDSIV